ncbi:AraC family transcriptional regulator [Stenotrophomonas tumulicola]|uniref:AraC family transcriptional regulator n=1 Tax=Stenotrophomonas tumulicola TaxID=1685415 RepID=A0A7W3FPR1_9GAMM|nr:AraC family transcriptional regulator [Stenotrophomonas tumulicola]MBA8683459.1 AraC family transcriptional regulator [Stenotrophomonas tumulicola]
MLDRLESLLDRFPVSARLLQGGRIAGHWVPSQGGSQPLLHLLRQGGVSVVGADGSLIRVDQPSVLLYARPQEHHFRVDDGIEVPLVTAQLRFEAGEGSPVAEALPSPVCLPLAALLGSDAVLGVLFEEAFAERCGRQAMLDRLFELVIIQVLRTLMENGQIQVGLLAGMGHPRLRHALVAMHEQPAEDWSLQTLAERAGMSRSAFSEGFREVIGSTPGQYLQAWRTRLAQQALRRGQPLKRIAGEVGFGSEAALSRAFKAQTGQSPRQWRNAIAP